MYLNNSQYLIYTRLKKQSLILSVFLEATVTMYAKCWNDTELVICYPKSHFSLSTDKKYTNKIKMNKETSEIGCIF